MNKYRTLLLLYLFCGIIIFFSWILAHSYPVPESHDTSFQAGINEANFNFFVAHLLCISPVMIALFVLGNATLLKNNISKHKKIAAITAVIMASLQLSFAFFCIRCATGPCDICCSDCQANWDGICGSGIELGGDNYCPCVEFYGDHYDVCFVVGIFVSSAFLPMIILPFVFLLYLVRLLFKAKWYVLLLIATAPLSLLLVVLFYQIILYYLFTVFVVIPVCFIIIKILLFLFHKYCCL